jgi:hypothetical protein
MPGGSKLTRQEQAVAALLTEPTIEAAARKAGVSERTLKEWLTRPDFAAAYGAARREVLAHAVARLQWAADLFVMVLIKNLQADRPADQIKAALGGLDRAIKGGELLDVQEQLADMKRRLEELERDPGRSQGAAGEDANAGGTPDEGGAPGARGDAG